MVISQTNMWANIQKAAAPWAVSWQFGDAAAWLPFFGMETLPLRHLGTLQPPLRCCLTAASSIRDCSENKTVES